MSSNEKLGLTGRQREYLRWIEGYIRDNDGEAPSYKDIGLGMGTSVSAAQRVVSEIIRRGHLRASKGSQRSLALVEVPVE